MKSRLLRALGVGAALLIPVSGLALLSGVDASPAGAFMSTTPHTLCFLYGGGIPVSHVKLVINTTRLGGNGNTSGSAGCVPMAEVGMSTTYKSTANYTYTTSVTGFFATLPADTITATYNASGIANVKLIPTGHGFEKLGTTGTYAHCEITTLPAMTFSDTRGQLPLKNTGVSLAGAMVVSYTPPGTCSTSAKTTIETKLAHTDASGILYVL